ncbi:hypothetical protein [uncultured Legionella sp.]|uniref:hypothetical protein n=1 Tax=uncultured Legionella sp. TaxID=210934 RepID=UPI002620FE27|nr:hypothetical protein [uncultured Legionella sp.]
MQSKKSSDPVLSYDLILTLYVAYIPITDASTFLSLCRYSNQQQNNYWEQKAKLYFPKAIGNERNNAKVLGMARK